MTHEIKQRSGAKSLELGLSGMNNNTQHQQLKQLGRRKTASPKPKPSTAVDGEVAAEDLLLEFEVRIWGRDQDVFHQTRVVPIWKGAFASGTYRSLASSDIVAQLRHLLRIVKIEMDGYTVKVDKPPPPKNKLPLTSDILPVFG